MALTISEVPFLRKQALLRMVQTNQAELYEQMFWCQQLFGLGNGGQPRLVDAEEIRVQQERDPRRGGVFMSQPGDGKSAKTVQGGEAVARILYQHYKDSLPPNYHVKLQQMGTTQPAAEDTTSALAASSVSRWQERTTRRLTAMCLRQLETWCCKYLSNGTADGTGTAFTLDVGGTPVNFDDTGVYQIDASANWAVASTDILADMGDFAQQHEDRAGLPISHIIYSHQLVTDLAKNDELRAVAQRSGGSQMITELPTSLMASEFSEAMTIKYTGFYGDRDTGTKTRFWPRYKMAFLSLQDPANTLDLVTVPTLSDDHQGGFYSKAYLDNSNDQLYLRVGHNGAPLILDSSKITVFNLQP